MWFVVISKIFLKAIADWLYFPIWWYSLGSVQAGRYCKNLFILGNNRLAPGLWLLNIFVPMFGQYDWQGRIISFFMRLFQIIVRSLALLIWLVICLLIFLLWLVAPVVLVWLIYQLGNLAN